MIEGEYHTQSMKAESGLHNSRTVVEADSPVTWFYPDSLDTDKKVNTPYIQVHKYGHSITLALKRLLYIKDCQLQTADMWSHRSSGTRTLIWAAETSASLRRWAGMPHRHDSAFFTLLYFSSILSLRPYFIGTDPSNLITARKHY
jgi:hypothetical protein